MSSQIQESTLAILSQQNMIEQNRQYRNNIYRTCMDNYLNHLKKQIGQFQQTERINLERNKKISQAFENVYDKITNSAGVTIRKMKQTSYQKKEFWENLIKNNNHLKDIQLKKDFYLQMHDAQDRYFDIIQQQKVKSIPYNILLGKNKKKQTLKDWQQNNKQFQDKVNKQMTTMNEWKNHMYINKLNNYQKSYQNNYFKTNNMINQALSYQLDPAYSKEFRRTNQNNINKVTNNSGNIKSINNYQTQREDFDILKNFQILK